MDDVERLRAEAEAHKSMNERSGRAWPHEDLLVRYLGALTYKSRRAAPRGDGQEAGRADVRADAGHGIEGVRGPSRSRKHRWRRER